MNNPLVSIIIPNYNHAAFLNQRLDSIFNQTFHDFEVILLDDHSSDNSLEILKEYSKNPKVSHLIVNEENSGSPFLQWGRGIKLAKGAYVWIAESDDYCDEKFLYNAVNELELNSNIGLVFCQSWKINESNTIIDTWLKWTDDLDNELFKHDFTYNGINFIDSFLVHKNVIPNTSAVVFRKRMYENVGGVNYNIKYCGDWFLWLKIAAVSDIAFITEHLNYFRYHSNSVIYKAVNSSDNSGIYPEKYQISMRKVFANWLKFRGLNYVAIISKNNYYISQECISQFEWYLKNKNYLQSINAGLKYIFLTKDLRFSKRIVKKLLKLI